VTRLLTSAAADVGRLQAELEQLRRERDQLAALLATPDPPADAGYRQSVLANAHAADIEVAESRGYVRAVAEMKGMQHALVNAMAAAAPPPDRWLVRCGNHRRKAGGPCGPAGQCERRTRETFGQPHPDDRRAPA
jgi:hypothetical protein